jgi:hypothetical protein
VGHAVTGLIAVVAVTALLVLALMPLWARRHISAHVSRYLRLHWSDQSRATLLSTAQGEDRDDLREVPRAEWTALDDHQLTRLLRDSSP